MAEKKEAVVLLAKCGAHQRTYGITAEKTPQEDWNVVWAFPLKESTARREGYDKTFIRGQIYIGPEYPGCPYCGARLFNICSCGHVFCNDGGTVSKCPWCGNTGCFNGEYDGRGITAGGDI